MNHQVSPGFLPRPSLSEAVVVAPCHVAAGVAGISYPAFVERRRGRRTSLRSPRVAGISTPVFVERPIPTRTSGCSPWRRRRGSTPAFVERASVGHLGELDHRVSPGFLPRPSLSDGVAALFNNPELS